MLTQPGPNSISSGGRTGGNKRKPGRKGVNLNDYAYIQIFLAECDRDGEKALNMLDAIEKLGDIKRLRKGIEQWQKLVKVVGSPAKANEAISVIADGF